MEKCAHCGGMLPHQGKCPSVKALEYYPDGQLKRVEYLTPADYNAAPLFTGWTQPSPNLTGAAVPPSVYETGFVGGAPDMTVIVR